MPRFPNPARYLFCAFLFLGAILSSCDGDRNRRRALAESAPALSQTLTDATGRQVQMSSSPGRVVSLAPNITEIIYAIGAQDRLVAVSTACDYPPQTGEIAAVQVYPTVDREEIVALKPDLILTTDEIFSPQDIAQLEALGVPVFAQRYRKLDDVPTAVAELGELLGVSGRGGEVADSLRNVLAKVRAATRGESRYRTMVLVSEDPLVVAGGKGFLHEMIAAAGGSNAFASIEDAYPTVTAEAILAARPEYIIVPAQDNRRYQNLLDQFPSLSTTSADVNHQVFLVNPDHFYRPGPRLFQGLLTLTQTLHSRLTRDEVMKGD